MPLDRSPHVERFLDINGARLQLLDWGGHGPVLLFMPGFGNGAHIFDELAPAFTERFHTLAVTPRGFPPSSAPDSGYAITQLAHDVRGLLDSLQVSTAVLAGHSISGAVLTHLQDSTLRGCLQPSTSMRLTTSATPTAARRRRSWRRLNHR